MRECEMTDATAQPSPISGPASTHFRGHPSLGRKGPTGARASAALDNIGASLGITGIARCAWSTRTWQVSWASWLRCSGSIADAARASLADDSESEQNVGRSYREVIHEDRAVRRRPGRALT